MTRLNEIRAAKRALAINPDNYEARLALVEALAAQGRFDDACLHARGMVEREPGNERIRLLLARLEIAGRRPAAALEVLLPLGEDASALALRAQAFELMGRPISAAAIRLRLAGRSTQGPALETMRIYFGAQLRELLSTASGGAPDGLFDALLEGQYAVAEPLFMSWVAEQSDQSLCALALADWYLLQGRADEAEAILSEHPVDDLRSWAVHNRLGDAALLRGDLHEARTCYRKATLLDACDWNAWLDLARVEYLRGALGAAETAASHVAETAPEPSISGTAAEFLKEITGSRDRGKGGEGGNVLGLAWCETGGSVLELEVLLRPGDGGIRVTGNVGRLMEDAAHTAISFLRESGHVPTPFEVHINLPHLSTFKDGGSAGLLIAASVFAAHHEVRFPALTGITGEIGLTGAVRPIGGLREKVTAAYLNGVEQVFYPAGNSHDLLQVPLSVRGKLRLIPVTHFDDIRDKF